MSLAAFLTTLMKLCSDRHRGITELMSISRATSALPLARAQELSSLQ